MKDIAYEYAKECIKKGWGNTETLVLLEALVATIDLLRAEKAIDVKPPTDETTLAGVSVLKDGWRWVSSSPLIRKK